MGAGKMAKTKVLRGPKKARRPQLNAPSPSQRRPVVSQRRAPSALTPPDRTPPFDYAQPGDSIGVRYDSLLHAVDIVKSGLPIAAVSRLAETSGLTLERIKQVARISEGSFSRRKQTGRLSQDESERLFRVGHVFERAVALHDGDRDGARHWLESPIPSLGNQRPLELAQTEPGAREVEDLIGRIEHGVVS